MENGAVASSQEIPPAVSDAELAAVVSVLQRLVNAEGAPTAEYSEPRLKPLRKALLPFLDSLRGHIFRGQEAEAYRRDKTSRKDRQIRMAAELARDRCTIDKTRLRAERLAKLKQLESCSPYARPPDGAVDDGAVPLLLTAGGALGQPLIEAGAPTDGALLASVRTCYTCKARYNQLHHFYDQLCPPCAALNFEKRHASAPLDGRVALVTGSRIKIGFHICLKLLRAGVRVVATTRFPHDAAMRFAAAPDFADWSARLQVVGIDLRDLAAVERLCAHLCAQLPRLDIVINNACQTVRRPPAYYAPLIGRELQPATSLPAHVLPLLAGNEQVANGRHLHLVRGLRAELAPPSAPATSSEAAAGGVNGGGGGGADGRVGPGGVAEAWQASVEGAAAHGLARGAVPSALLSQFALIDGDEAELSQPATEGGHDSAGAGDGAQFPIGCVDVNGQQLDLRSRNSWLLRLDEVSTTEAAEVLAINSLAPFVLNSKLKPLLVRTAEAASVPTFIVNVSAMEGKFYRQKTACHPHTNMAKVRAAPLAPLTLSFTRAAACCHSVPLTAPSD